MAKQVALIFGYGPRVGFDVAATLASQGYSIAVVSRSPKNDQDKAQGYLRLQADLSDSSSVETAFTKVIKDLGHPSVVVYNAGAMTVDRSAPVAQQVASFQADLNVSIVNAYAAAHLAVKSFETLPEASSKTFIYTGNKLPFMIVQPLLSEGVGKAGTAHLIHYLAEEYKDKPYKFYFADERKENGDPAYSEIDGPTHASFFSQLVKDKSQGPWNATFVKGKGYVKFPEDVTHEAHLMNQETHKVTKA